MAVLSLLGSAGAGLVWGWLMGGFGGPMTHPIRTSLVLIGATLVSAMVVFWLAGLVSGLTFLAAVGIAAGSRHSWYRRLAERREPLQN
jgi:hypothetical protein